MWVVKIGGSLTLDPLLPEWLALLGTAGRGRVAIVPGGGGFADEARRVQAHCRVDDVSAHNMAVLAMAQTGMALRAQCPALKTASNWRELRDIVRGGETGIWLPFDLLQERHGALTSWDVTSDSLAAHLAWILCAEQLVVVKSCPIDPGWSITDMSANGILDRSFPELARDAPFNIRVVNKTDLEEMDAFLQGLPCAPPAWMPESAPLDMPLTGWNDQPAANGMFRLAGEGE
ncbi:amino acid kinase family protein [Xanthobacter sp. TB0139]|uniref:amino acid kinase family protein n=1 Tax=Xanthobacter sp. TB0139 TaxID=3459178 RepID=UPI0040399D59